MRRYLRELRAALKALFRDPLMNPPWAEGVRQPIKFILVAYAGFWRAVGSWASGDGWKVPPWKEQPGWKPLGPVAVTPKYEDET